MFFFQRKRGNRSQTRNSVGRETRQRFCPTLECLEVRALLNGTPGAATHLLVKVPESVQVGQTFNVLVEAEDASNRDATGYTGTVALSLGTADALATLPANYTFTAKDHGEHWFKLTLGTTGSETVIATDTATASITGKAATTVTPAPVATTVVVQTPETAAVGVPTRVSVTILDQSGHVLPNYTGTVTLTSSDTQATGTSAHKTAPAALPITYTFTAQDHGRHDFQLTFQTAGAVTVTATATLSSTSKSTITSQASLTTSPATTVTQFALVPLFFGAVVGTPAPVEVVALNASGQVVIGYKGTVSFSSSDTTATAAATKAGTATGLATFNYTFTAADNGKHLFYLTFGTAGKQSLTVTDLATKIAASDMLQVLAAHHHS